MFVKQVMRSQRNCLKFHHKPLKKHHEDDIHLKQTIHKSSTGFFRTFILQNIIGWLLPFNKRSNKSNSVAKWCLLPGYQENFPPENFPLENCSLWKYSPMNIHPYESFPLWKLPHRNSPPRKLPPGKITPNEIPSPYCTTLAAPYCYTASRTMLAI